MEKRILESGIWLSLTLSFLWLNMHLPHFVLATTNFNSFMHISGGVLAAWLSKILLELNGNRRADLGLVFVYASVWVSIWAHVHIAESFLNWSLPRARHKILYDDMVVNLSVQSIVGLAIGVFSLVFVYLVLNSSGAYLSTRWFSVLAITVGGISWGVNWELYEFWIQGYDKLSSETNLTLYQDTIKDLVMNDAGIALFASIYWAFKKLPDK